MDFQKEFPLDEDILYLNHAAVAPWPKRTQIAVQNFASQNTHQGSQAYLKWLETEQLLREQFKTLINAKSHHEIALLKSTSEGLSVIAHGLKWRAGDEIIISNEEFPSNRIVWESLKDQGVKVLEVDLAQDHVGAIKAAITGNTKLIAISSVQYASGRIVDVTALGNICSDNNILFCVDAIQSLGVMPLDAQEIKADFIVGDGHKWMLGPEGLALFYCKQDKQDLLTLRQYGWHMVEKAGDFDQKQWQPANNAKRFECGSPNMLGIHALSASLSLILEYGIDAIHEKTQELHHYLRTKLQHAGYEIISPDEICGITTFKTSSPNHKELYTKLMASNVMCAYRGGGIRFSPHFYQDHTMIDKALIIVADIICKQKNEL